MRLVPWLAAGLCLLSSPASAGTHVVQRGETLEHVAKIYGCTTDQVLRANRLRTTLVKTGTVVSIPACTVAARAKARSRRIDDDDLDARADLALAVIDGTAVVGAKARPRSLASVEPRHQGTAAAVGEPWNGRLVNGEPLPEDDGYQIRRPHRAYGASHVVDHLRGAIASVRALHEVHTLAIGDLSDRDGGRIGGHQSHQSGLDVDVGFYFRRVPDGYPDRFVPANADLDLGAMWALAIAFARTVDVETGVEIVFLDYDVQRRLHEFARRRGTPDDQLSTLFQYPRGKDALVGLFRHWPGHADHFHVRFKPGR